MTGKERYTTRNAVLHVCVRRKPGLKSELGHVPVGVLGIRLTKLKHAIGLTKLNYLELGHAPVGGLGIRLTELKACHRTLYSLN